MKNNLNLPQIDECRLLILKMIEQAVRDYLSLENNAAPIDRFYYESACKFLFDNSFVVNYGGVEKTLEDFLDILDIDLRWFREQVVRIKNKKIIEQRKENEITNDSGMDLEWD